tara:strand:- start:1206 stop:1703 length:498 start_codon:yes stop_codon:yes gene_type:complete
MPRNYLLDKSKNVSFLARLFAKAVDLFIVLILSILFYPVGILLGIVYLSLSDSLQNGQSVGKKLVGFCVVSLKDGTKCSYKQSLVRNITLSVPVLVGIIPVWGWLLTLLMALPIIGLEIYLMMKLDSAHRLGDVLADTSVINQLTDEEKKQVKAEWFNGQPEINN